MKKIFLTLSLILTAIFLVSCKGNRVIIDIKILDEDHTSNTLNFKLVVNDLDSHLEGKIKLELTNTAGEKKGTIKPDSIGLGEVETSVTISGLEINTQYTFKVLGTIKGKSKTLLTTLLSTKNNKQYDVKTPEDFLSIKKDTYGTYKLLNDIDFSGVELKQEDLMPTFYGVLDGQGYTVKNMTVSFSSSPLYKGIFEQNNRDSIIKNIKFDNIEFGSEETPLSKNGTQYIGILVGSTSTTSIIDNVTVTNSKIYYESKSTSTNHSVGILIGRNQGEVKNVILENNELHYVASKIKSLKAGGAIGISRTKTASIENLYVDNKLDITLNLEDYGTDGMDIHIGGAVGFVEDPSRNNPANSIISKTDIVINDFGVKIKGIKDTVKDQTIKYNLYVGGVIGDFTVSAIQKVFFDGSITINHEVSKIFIEQAIKDLNSYVDSLKKDKEGNDNYSEENWELIENELEQAITNINESTNQLSFYKNVNDGLEAINEVPLISEEVKSKKTVEILIKYTVGGIVGDYSSSHKIYDSIIKSKDIEVNIDNEDMFKAGDIYGYKSNSKVDEVKFYEDFDNDEEFIEALRDLFSNKIVDKYLE